MISISLSRYSALLIGFLVSIYIFISPAHSSQPRVYRIAVLSSGVPGTDPDNSTMRGFREGLKEFGYVEGKNIVLSIPDNKSFAELELLITIYEKGNVDLFIAGGSTEAAIIKKTATKTPVVFMPAVDPQRAGFVQSLARPGTNFTGIAYDSGEEMRGKQLEIFKSIAPNVRRLLVLYDATVESPIQSRSMLLLNKLAPRLNFTLVDKPIKLHAEGVQLASRENVDGVFILCTNFFSRDNKTPMVAVKKKLPLHGCPTQTRKFSALFSYGPELFSLGRRGAWYVDQILKGNKPAILPVETPKRFELVINLSTAAAIGLKISPEILQQADQVIR